MPGIRPAKESEFIRIRRFYDALIDGMQTSPFAPGWEKGIYPADAALQQAVSQGEMILAEEDGDILAAMVLNHTFDPEYDTMPWQVSAADEEVTVIHLLGVLPAAGGKGLGRRMVQYAIDTARAQKQKAVRLDVVPHNLPAIRLYESLGFCRIGEFKRIFEDGTSLALLLYEYPL